MKESNKKCWRSAALILLGISMTAAARQAVSADSPAAQPAAGQQVQVEKVSQPSTAQPGETENQNSSESKVPENKEANESRANVQQTNQTSGSQSVSAVTSTNQEAQTAADQFYNYEYKYAPKIRRGQRRLPVNQRAASRYFSSAARAAAPKYKTFKNKRAYHRVKTVPDEKMQQAVSKAEKTQKVAKAQPAEKRRVKQAAPASSRSSSAFKASVSSASVKQIMTASTNTSSQLNLAVDLGSQTTANQNSKAKNKRKANRGASVEEKHVFEQGDKLVKASGGYSRAEVVTIVVLLAGLALSGFAFDEINKKMFN